MRKSEAFVLEEAIASPDGHHLRCCNELLPAALGGEAPLAKIVACQTIIFLTIQRNITKLMLNISHRTTDMSTFSILLALSERITQEKRKWRKQQ
jgi:hypothetical protein